MAADGSKDGKNRGKKPKIYYGDQYDRRYVRKNPLLQSEGSCRKELALFGL
jgi:hypothetical protein